LLKSIKEVGGLAAEVIKAAELPQSVFANKKVELNRLLEASYSQAAILAHPYVGTEHLLLGFLSLTKSRYLEKVKDKVLELGTYSEPYQPDQGGLSLQNEGVSLVAQLTDNLTDKALLGQLPLLVDRKKEFHLLATILLKKSKNNPLLIGDLGVGKTSLVENLAQQIITYQVPRPLMGIRLLRFRWSAFLSSPLSQRNMLGTFSLFLEEVARSGNTILFLDDLDTLASLGGSGIKSPSPLLALLPDFLASGLQVIAAVDSKSANLILDGGLGLERYFQPLLVSEFSKEAVADFLDQILPLYEQHHQVTISREVISPLIDLSARFLPDRTYPGKVLDILDGASAKVRFEREELSPGFRRQLINFERLTKECWHALEKNQYEQALELRTQRDHLASKLVRWQTKPRRSWGKVGRSQVLSALSELSGVPVGDLTASEASRYLRLEKELSRKMVGQTEAVKAVCKALRKARLRLGSETRPIGNFMFLGPTGVGKTHLARTVAEVLFGGDHFLKLDMSGFRERHTVSRLIGAPPGYVGYDEGGELVNFVQEHPYSVILFDEVDKAHPEVLNILLQVMEDGVLTDGQGQTADFSNTIIIMTSNFGSQLVGKGALGFSQESEGNDSQDYASMQERLLLNLKKVLKPEFINRLDQSIVFRRLSSEDMYRICTLEGNKIVQRFAAKGIKLKILPKAKKLLVEWGTSDEYGARPLRRLMEDKIIGPLSEMLLRKEVGFGDFVRVRAVGGKLVFEVSKK